MKWQSLPDTYDEEALVDNQGNLLVILGQFRSDRCWQIGMNSKLGFIFPDIDKNFISKETAKKYAEEQVNKAVTGWL